MSRTDLDATTLANSLRMRAGDGSIEWVSEPIQASVLLDIADMLDENAKLRDLTERFCWYVRSTYQDESYIKFQDGLISTFKNLCDGIGIEVNK